MTSTIVADDVSGSTLKKNQTKTGVAPGLVCILSYSYTVKTQLQTSLHPAPTPPFQD